MPGAHVPVALGDGGGDGHVAVLAIHVVGAAAGVVPGIREKWKRVNSLSWKQATKKVTVNGWSTAERERNGQSLQATLVSKSVEKRLFTAIQAAPTTEPVKWRVLLNWRKVVT